METTVNELISLRTDVRLRKPTIRELTAASGFLAQFYNGLENILKRINNYYDIPLPKSDMWHIELFERFCSPSYSPLPELFDPVLADDLTPYRQFRHVAHHSYGFQIDWDRMEDGIMGIKDIFMQSKAKILDWLNTL